MGEGRERRDEETDLMEKGKYGGMREQGLVSDAGCWNCGGNDGWVESLLLSYGRTR